MISAKTKYILQSYTSHYIKKKKKNIHENGYLLMYFPKRFQNRKRRKSLP